MFKSWNALVGIGFIGTLLICSAQANNSINAAQPRRCYSCEGVNCLRTSMTEVSSNCGDLLDICVTVFNEFAVVAKGCYLDMPEQYRNKCDQRNNPECLKCFGELCNNLGRADFKCIQCKSTDNSKCSSDTSDISAVQCAIPTAPNSYCYVKQTDANVERGCLRHVKEQLDCLQDTSCSMCLSGDGEACNAFQLSTSSSAHSIASLSVSAMLALIAATLCRR